jgi:hypothetical protein
MNNIRRLAGMIGLTMFCLSSLAHSTSFTIEFTNRHEVVTSRVWEEGNELKFDIYQGTAGVPRTFVKRIKSGSLVSNDNVARSAISLGPGDPGASMADNQSAPSVHQDADGGRAAGQRTFDPEGKQVGKRTPNAADVSADREQKSVLTRQFDDATKRYREASAAGNLDTKKAAWDDLTAYRKKLIELADEVSQKNDGVVPPWWNE